MQQINMGFMQMQTQTACPVCQGKGRTHLKDCAHCRGKRLVMEGKNFVVDIERGMANNEKLLYEKQGEQVPDMIQGDITFVLKQQTHPVFKRVANNLYMNVDISLKEALLGFSRTVTHMDGHEFEIKAQRGEV